VSALKPDWSSSQACQKWRVLDGERFTNSNQMKPAFKKLLSALFVTLTYAVAGYAFFFVFFRSQF
jgi:hypothetical protein